MGIGVAEAVRRLLGIEGLTVCGVHFEPVGLVVDVKPRWRKRRCAVCGRPCPGYDEHPVRLWRHLSWGGLRVWLRYVPRRANCREHGVRVEMVPWAEQEAHFTKDFDEMTAWLTQRMDKSTVCRLMGINWRTVGTIVNRVVVRMHKQRFDDLSIIGVDELAHRRHHKYITVVVDHLESRVIWVGEGKGEQTLQQFFNELGPERASKLTHVTMDMSAAYDKVVSERAPKAQKVFDRFHVQKLAGEAVDAVRREEMHKVAGTEDAAALKRSRWALLKNPWNLTVPQGKKLREVQRTNQRLYRAYLLKEFLAKGMEYRQPKRAMEHLDEWMQWASHSKLRPFARLSRTVGAHLDGILAYVKTGLSNGVVEGLNNKIRLLIRRAFGFKNTDALKAMIYLCCGGLELHPPLPAASPQ